MIPLKKTTKRKIVENIAVTNREIICSDREKMEEILFQFKKSGIKSKILDQACLKCGPKILNAAQSKTLHIFSNTMLYPC